LRDTKRSSQYGHWRTSVTATVSRCYVPDGRQP
jgi:hypothetical protein